MTKETDPNQAPENAAASAPDRGPAGGADPDVALEQCAAKEDLLGLLLERATSIYPCENWLFGEIPDPENPVEVEILAYSPTRLQKVYQGMRIPILQSGFSRRLYQEHCLSYVGEDNGSITQLNPQFVETFALSSFMGVPLLFEDRIAGILFAATFKGEKACVPSESQQEALMRLAQAGALALHRIQAQAAR
ncbi:MAG: GAF domain-containing protein [Holophagaceae bacterium]|nr:GAF domain-containing protein [Holophagaceae bacterium]